MAKKILLADDSPTIRKVVELTFADEGIEVYPVPDGDSAMVTFVRVEPDMVIADVNMPGMSGYRLCEMIKQDETTRHIPVILLVGSFEPFDAGEASRVGCDHYFTKPFRSIRELVDKVHECFAPGYGAAAAHHDTADIEDLYKSSLDPDLEEPRPEDEVPAFAAAGESIGETHFDDGATLDEFLTESTHGQVLTGNFGRPSYQNGEPGIDDEPAAPEFGGSGQIFDESELFDPFYEDDSSADTPAEKAPETHPAADDSDNDDVLGIGGRDSAYDEVDDVVFDVEPAAAETEPDNEPSDLHLTAVPPERVRTTGELGPSPWEQPAVETRATEEPAAETDASEAHPVELGDAGMDDEIIETSHPSSVFAPESVNEPPARFGLNAAPIDPFNERVGISTSPAAETPAYEQADDLAVEPVEEHAFEPADEYAVERADEHVFEQAEPAHEEALVVDEDVVNTQTEPEPVETPKSETPSLGAHVTPELIESIVASVLEKMSDRAVRDAAQEAVPRIAEKLIREALTDDKHEERADAAKE